MLREASRLRDLYRAYGLLGMIRLALDVLLTRLTVPGARILRRPVYLRGRRWILVGSGFTSGPGLRIDAMPIAANLTKAIVVIGHGVQVNDYVHIAGVQSVTIGNRVLIASKVLITDHGHGSTKGNGDSPLIPPAQRRLSSDPVIVEDDVWIGEFVAVLQGVTIGKGAIIGAMSTVTHNIPPFSVAVGSPARVIKRYNFETCRWDSV